MKLASFLRSKNPIVEESMSLSSNDKAIEVLETQVASLKEQLKALSTERDEARELVGSLTESNDELKASVGKDMDAFTQAKSQIAELQGQIRMRTHFEKFSELAKGARAKEAALKQLWKLGEYKADDEVPDEKALGKLVTRLKAENDFAFEPDETPEAKATREANTRRTEAWSGTKYGIVPNQTPEPAGSGRAQRNIGGDGTIITAEMRGDPKFMLDPRNREMITLAAKEGRFR
jgi:hypothetical protein